MSRVFVPLIAASLAAGLPGFAADVNLRADVNMVLAPVIVVDSHGRSVTGLDRNSFRVFDGSEPRQISSFAGEDAPVSAGLIFDCSASMNGKFKTASRAPALLFQELNEADESFLVTISSKAELRRSFTPDFGEIQNALVSTRPAGTTSLIDGVVLALHEMRKAKNSRKALVIVSDGEDNHSRYTLRELTRLAVESDTQIFAAGLYREPAAGEELLGPMLLSRLAGQTGGMHLRVRDENELRAGMRMIGEILHREYLIGYYPRAGAPAGKYRKIKVQVTAPSARLPLYVRARSGYYVPAR
jgi:Ca-activated chloride channel family protein